MEKNRKTEKTKYRNIPFVFVFQRFQEQLHLFGSASYFQHLRIPELSRATQKDQKHARATLRHWSAQSYWQKNAERPSYSVVGCHHGKESERLREQEAGTYFLS